MIRVRLAVCVGLFICLAAVDSAPGDTKDKAKYKVTDDEKTVFDLTNKERKAKDLPTFKLNLTLCAVARAHSENMATQKEMKHELDGKTPADRVKAAGYLYSTTAENIAAGERWDNLPDVLDKWMNSKPHRENILNEKLEELGIGIAKNEKGEIYYTQVFGTERKKR